MTSLMDICCARVKVAGRKTLKKATFADTGTYRIDGDTICGKWNKIRNGREACSRLYRIGENRYRVVYTSGREGGTLTFK